MKWTIDTLIGVAYFRLYSESEKKYYDLNNTDPDQYGTLYINKQKELCGFELNYNTDPGLYILSFDKIREDLKGFFSSSFKNNNMILMNKLSDCHYEYAIPTEILFNINNEDEILGIEFLYKPLDIN